MSRHRYPFALGSTSYVIPADILPNVRRLAPLVDDIELVLFETPTASNMPGAAEVRELGDLGREHGTGFTVHLPTADRAGSSCRAERERYCASALRVIDVCAPLAPRAWIAHLEGIGPGASAAEVAAWQGWCGETLAALRAAVPTDTAVAVENLGYRWTQHRDLAENADCVLCCDIGHLWLYFPDSWEEELAAMLPRTAVIHLHGVADGRDHISLRKSDDELCRILLARLKLANYAGVVTMEVFNESDFVGSANHMRDLWEELSL
jgi:sugar phosphate isomerase/epimerase